MLLKKKALHIILSCITRITAIINMNTRVCLIGHKNTRWHNNQHYSVTSSEGIVCPITACIELCTMEIMNFSCLLQKHICMRPQYVFYKAVNSVRKNFGKGVFDFQTSFYNEFYFLDWL